MALYSTDLAQTQRAIRVAYERAVDAHTVEDAARYHSELIDLLAVEAVIVRTSSGLLQPKKDALLRDITGCAEHHRDAVDRLTDIIEGNQQLVWRPSTA
jgi:hypothetical protein